MNQSTDALFYLTKNINKMKTVTLSEEFVKEAYNDACCEWKKRIESELPELFEKQLNQWYINTREQIWFVKKIINGCGYGYGFDSEGNWADEELGFNYSLKREATDKEVETALIKEAKKRGFKEGVCFVPTNGNQPINRCNECRFGFDLRSNKMLMNNYSIFQNGVWAERIETPIPKKLQKLIDEYGKEKIKEMLS